MPEKWRETITIGPTHLCIDRLPFGRFLEIEGEKADIRSVADSIGMNWENRIVLNYHGIFTILKKELNLGFTDITFDNFQKIAVDLNRYEHLFT